MQTTGDIVQEITIQRILAAEDVSNQILRTTPYGGLALFGSRSHRMQHYPISENMEETT